jgi:hypothetical protein
LAFVILDRTHTVRRSKMGAASATISSLDLDLDLSKQRVLMRMRSSARCGAVVLARGWPETTTGWTCAQGTQAWLRQLRRGDGDNERGGRIGRMCSTPDPCTSIYSGVHRVRPLRLLPPYDAHRNGSISIISREDHVGFFATRLSNDLKL